MHLSVGSFAALADPDAETTATLPGPTASTTSLKKLKALTRRALTHSAWADSPPHPSSGTQDVSLPLEGNLFCSKGHDQEGFAERFVGDLTGSDLLTCHCTRMAFKVGDQVKWKSHSGEAQGTVVRVVHEDGEVGGFQYRASREDPRYIVELKDGQRAAHTEAALSKT